MRNLIKRILNYTNAEPSDFMAVERAERIFYLQNLREGMTVFDVGANVGELTLLFSSVVGKAGNVHAFEACASTFKRLRTVCEATEKKNVQLNYLALSDHIGEIELNVYEELFSGFNTQAARRLINYGIDLEPVSVETIAAVTVDHYCAENKIEWIDLLKIDVEGAELQVLKGAKTMLNNKRIGCISFEFGQTTFDMGNTPTEIKAWLQSYGYKIRNLIPGDKIFPGGESVATARYAMHIATPFH